LSVSGHVYRVHVTPEWTGRLEAIMSMMEIMDMIVMREESDGSAGSTGYADEMNKRLQQQSFKESAAIRLPRFICRDVHP
jgi:hypothetical protein